MTYHGVAQSLRLFDQARELIAGQTHLLSRHPSRHAWGVSPIYAEAAAGCRFTDVDGNEFIDMAGGTGVVYLGYCHPEVDDAAIGQIRRGIAYPVNSPLEIELAELLVEAIPCAERVRYTKGGGDADAVAVRLARCYTGRDKALFCGYHGWHDWYLASNLASPENLHDHLFPGVPAGGVPRALAGTAIPFAYNDLNDLRAKLEANRGQVACVIMEAARTFQPEPGFLEGVRELADEHEAVLIFDEVVTGFRYALGGAQERFGVTPDMATFGKAIGNGYPVAAVTGKRAIMDSIASSFVSSSYWSEPASLAAAVAIQRVIRRENVIDHIWRVGARMQEGVLRVARDHGLPLTIAGLPPVFTLKLGLEPSAKYATLMIQEMAKRGVHMLTGVYMMHAHQDDDVDRVLFAFDEAAGVLRRAMESGEPDRFLETPEASSVFGRRLV